jgi:probable HAF family extracellular repeat protein
MARLRTWHVIPLAVLAAALGLPAAAAAPAAAATTTTYTITDLGSLGGTNYPQTQPDAINASGQVTGFSETSTTITFPCPTHYNPRRTCSSHPAHAFVYSNGTMTNLGTLNDVYSQGNSINVSGEVAGDASKPGPSIEAALWTGTTAVDLGALAPLSSGSWSIANGINDSGQVVGYWASSEGQINTGAHPWLYSNGTMTSLPEPSGLTAPSCDPGAINNSGLIIGSCATNNGGTSHAVLWQNGTVTTLGTLGGLQVTDLTGINNNGQIVGWGETSTGATHGFLDSNGTVTDLGAFLPNGLNDNGVIIGTELNGGAFIYSGGTVQDLNNLIPANSGYTITDAAAINDNGQIIAQASDATTSEAAVLLTPN